MHNNTRIELYIYKLFYVKKYCFTKMYKHYLPLLAMILIALPSITHGGKCDGASGQNPTAKYYLKQRHTGSKVDVEKAIIEWQIPDKMFRKCFDTSNIKLEDRNLTILSQILGKLNHLDISLLGITNGSLM